MCAGRPEIYADIFFFFFFGIESKGAGVPGNDKSVTRVVGLFLPTPCTIDRGCKEGGEGGRGEAKGILTCLFSFTSKLILVMEMGHDLLKFVVSKA